MMKTLTKRGFVPSVLLCACLPVWASQAYVSLLAPGGSVSQFNVAGGTLSSTFAAPGGAVDLLLTANGQELYVGTSSVSQADVRGGAPPVVEVLNATTGAVLHTFSMPASVVKMVLNATGSFIFATGLQGTGQTVVLMSLNLKTGATASVAIPEASAFNLYTLAISPNGKTIYVPVSNRIDIFNASTLTSTGSIPLPGSTIVAPPAVTPDGSTLLAAGGRSVYVIDLASKALKTTIPITASAAAFGSVLSPDGTTFYVSAGTLTAIDVASLAVTGSVALGQTNPFRLAISPDGSTLFATDLTYDTTAVVNAASLAVEKTLYSIAPPYAVAETASGTLLVLNENGCSLWLVDTASMTTTASFLAGDSPGAPAFADGKLFIPQAGNLAIQETPLTPELAKPLADNFIETQTAVTLGGNVYANFSGIVRAINPALEKVTKSFNIRTGQGAVNAMAASGDGVSLLATYQVGGDDGLTAAGIAKLNTTSGAQQLLSSFPFAPAAVASSPDGTRAYAVGLTFPDQVGAWNTQSNTFLSAATIAGNPSYIAIAVSADGSTLYLVNQNGTVDFVNAGSLELIASIAVGSHPSGISVNVEGTEALVTDSTLTSVTVLDLVSPSVMGTVPVGAISTGSVFLN